MIYDELCRFYKNFKGRKCIIGYSFAGRPIFAFHVGDDFGRQYISTYAIHGREWITARLGIRHIVRPSDCGGWIIPLVNPDGACISLTIDPMWKANARGVDLNVNFDAGWGTGKFNTRRRGGENCIGDHPFSESESSALAAFTLKIAPFVTFSFHTKGGEIYWEFCGKGDKNGAMLLSKATGYSVRTLYGSAGGYKDWCIDKLGIPAYTIECGDDGLKHPLTNLSALKSCFGALKYFTENYEK